jgi:hypothetical protein
MKRAIPFFNLSKRAKDLKLRSLAIGLNADGFQAGSGISGASTKRP